MEAVGSYQRQDISNSCSISCPGGAFRVFLLPESFWHVPWNCCSHLLKLWVTSRNVHPDMVFCRKELHDFMGFFKDKCQATFINSVKLVCLKSFFSFLVASYWVLLLAVLASSWMGLRGWSVARCPPKVPTALRQENTGVDEGGWLDGWF